MDYQSDTSQILHSIQESTKIEPKTLGILFGIKLISETQGEETGADFTNNQDFEGWLEGNLNRYGLIDEWNSLPRLNNEQLADIYNTLNKNQFIDDGRKTRLFSTLSDLLVNGNRGQFSFPSALVPIVQNVIVDHHGRTLITGSAIDPLLDIPYNNECQGSTIGEIHPLINRLAQELIEDYQNIPTQYLVLDESDQYSVIVGIPPFKMKHSNPEIIENFELADRGRGKRSRKTDAEILWIEKSYRLLSGDGQLVILLTDGFLSNASIKFAREWVLERFKIEAVISLPFSIFRPHSSIKTSLVCLRKLSPPPIEYNIFMAELEHDELIDPSKIIGAYQTFLQGATV